ncbi:ParM/StbA family protein [Almyronema epifaneia]|uniref:ParM/StbA family protein n=1 Tax=Almyronema epifaneia S1 TaxID=2991925 RepID=A0ABW6ILY2_9CYAN
MVQAISTPAQSAQVSQICPICPVGADIGNGALKLVTGSGETRLDSYICYLSERLSMGQTRGYVEYLQGDRNGLEGKQWIGGINAYYHDPRGAARVTDDKTGKVSLGLQLLLSALSELPHRSEWTLSVTCSVHDGQTLGKALKSALEGTHQIMLNSKRSTVAITVNGVLEEGTGAVISYKNQADFTNALLYDLGNGTLIFSSFNGLAMTDRSYSQNGGVESLIDAIASNELVRKKLLKEGDRHLIRAGIESGKFTYGTQYPDWNFADAYKAELPKWVDRVLKPLVRPTEDRMHSATALLAIGGGACLPGIAALLAKRNIQVLPEPQWANARGLYAYAVRRVASDRG